MITDTAAGDLLEYRSQHGARVHVSRIRPTDDITLHDDVRGEPRLVSLWRGKSSPTHAHEITLNPLI